MLIYLGSGFLPGVPARNLTDEEVKKHEETKLLDSGLYTKRLSKKSMSGGKENK